MARHQSTRQATTRQGGSPPTTPHGEGTGRRLPWRLALVVALVAAVALVLASKPTRQDATGATPPRATTATTTARTAAAPVAAAPAATAPTTPTPASAASPPAASRGSEPAPPVATTGTQTPPAPPTTAPANVTPVVSHAPSEPAAGLPRLVDLGADRCIPCKAMAPILVELRQQYAGRMQVDFIDVWKDPSAGDPYNIYSIPTQIFFDEHGRELTRHLGFMSKEDILATWKRVGYDFSIPGPATPKS